MEIAMKNLLYIASEGVPFIKTGGLADVVGSLPKCIDSRYFDVRVIIPKYGCMKQNMKDLLQYKFNFYMDFNWKSEYVGIFEAVVPSPRCWKYPGNHGSINLSQAIMHSCNYYFYEVGFRLSTDYAGRYSDSLGISKIKRYAEMKKNN